MQIMPYITLVVFTFGVLFRLGRWVGSRIVHNITLAPFPQSNTQVLGIFATEVIFFRSLFSSDRTLWIGAWLMHVALLNVIGGHIVGIYTLGEEFIYLGLSSDLSKDLSALLGITFGILLLAALVYLLIRRFTITKVKEVSGASDYLMLVLLLAIVTIGDIMRVFEHQFGIDYAPVKDYVGHLIMFKSLPFDHLALTTPLFVLHIFFVQILLMLFPFSKLMHVLGMFANRWIINRVYKDPAPGLPNVDIAAARQAGIGVPSGEGGV
jgi:respiratory nitrate reductase gamma subunit